MQSRFHGCLTPMHCHLVNVCLRAVKMDTFVAPQNSQPSSVSPFFWHKTAPAHISATLIVIRNLYSSSLALPCLSLAPRI